MTEPCNPATTMTLDALFGACVERGRDVAAVRWTESDDGVARGDTRPTMTYGELDVASARLAAELVARGVRIGGVVVLCLPRGPQQMVGLLAILRAGAAVLPLDPAYPRDLLAYMLADSAAGTVVTDRVTGESLPEGGAGRVFVGESSGACVESLLPASQWGSGLCYVLYTSGSTGRPKGVAMPHRAIVNLVEWQREFLPLKAGARVLQFAPLSFDVGFQEVFSTWAEGGTLVLVDEATRLDPRALWRLIAEEDVERVFLPYVALQALAEHAPEVLPPCLGDVIAAGEQLRVTPQIRVLFERLDRARLHNHYGPTETHVSTAYTLTGKPAEWPLLPPIGLPIARTEVKLIDNDGQLSDEGEIHIGGACLADGYFRRSDLTTERFVTLDGRRFYRTGDLGRRREDGALEYIGRADDQLKVRGFRVEPGEIEAQLSQHPAVQECAVTARDRRLLAYWVGDSVEPAELREFLGNRLPAQFVPTFFTRVDAMPLTASGKIDRRALPEPVVPTGSGAAAKPASELEAVIARIWSGVLRLPAVPRDVNFGDLGGTSLHAAEAQASLGRELQRELPVTQLHEYPTVAALARALEGNGTGASLGERTQSRAAAQRAALNQRGDAARRKPQPADA